MLTTSNHAYTILPRLINIPNIVEIVEWLSMF